jgi:lysyl-tRNA synthetase class 1
MAESHRYNLSKIKDGVSWSTAVTEEITSLYKDEAVYTVAAGISPSGIVHFGNFRDVITAHAVRESLVQNGRRARLIFSWDNFDRFRKVPLGVPASFSEHIGKPLSKIPDPFGTLPSYAERFQYPFVEAMQKLQIEIEYRNQTELYENGVYDDQIKLALSERMKIAKTLLSFMTEKAMTEKNIDSKFFQDNFYPISIYSRFTGKDSTKILEYDGDMQITYLCIETGKTDVVDLRKNHIAKLNWKVDWPMRWQYERVHFEPGGHDHASPGGSYDVSSVIAKELFNYEPPVFIEYKFVGIQGLGSKMSGSKGNAVSPLDLLDIYEPELLKWLYLKKAPNQSFELAFNTEIYRQYDEYDAEHAELKSIPFRQLVGLGQIVQWQEDKLLSIVKEMALNYAQESISRRLPLARNWLVKYNPGEFIALNQEPNKLYADTLSPEQMERIATLHNELLDKKEASIADLESLVYEIPKKQQFTESELKKEQRAFFKDIYNLLISKDTGPRLGTFLWAVDRIQVLNLLSFKKGVTD